MREIPGAPTALSRVFTIVLLLGLGHTAEADTDWTGPVFGSWFTPANWSSGVPDSNDAALINTGLAAIENGSLTAESRRVIIGASNTGPAAGIGISGTLNTGSLVIGRDGGASGILTAGTGSVISVVPQDLDVDTFTVGQSGTGSILLSSNGQVTTRAQVFIGALGGSSGSVILNGGVFQSITFLGAEIAPAGSATITVNGGGRFDLQSFGGDHIGRNGGLAAVSVSGANSRLLLSTPTVYSASTFTVSGGGSIEVDSLTNEAGIWDIKVGGALVASDILDLGNASEINLEIGGLAAADQGLLSAEIFYLDGDMTIELVNGFQPALGNSFSILAGNFWSGAFDTLSLPSLNPGLTWNTSSLYTTGTITVVPEPSTSAFLATFGVVWSLRRRRLPNFYLP